MEGLDRPEPMLFRTPETMKHFVWRGVKHTLCAQPIRWSLQIVALLSFIVWGLFAGQWQPAIIFLVLTVLLRGFLLLSYVRFYRVLRNSAHYRVDKHGISLVLECAEGDFVCGETDSWHLVRRVYAYQDFIALKMERAAKGANEYLLFTEDIAKARNHILSFWQLSLRGIPPEELPDFYTEEEQEDVTCFIERNFGEIECFGHEKESCGLHIDLAVIKPTDERPYYTICTIGAGAFRMSVPVEERQTRRHSEYNEYLIYLPARWNVTGEGFDKEENWWPLRLLKDCARDIMRLDGYFSDNDLYVFEKPFDASTCACAAYFDYPLPDTAIPAKVNLSTGRTVIFLQVVPLNREEVGYYDEQNGYVARYQRFFGIDLEAIAEASPEERRSIFEQRFLEHFERMVSR